MTPSGGGVARVSDNASPQLEGCGNIGTLGEALRNVNLMHSPITVAAEDGEIVEINAQETDEFKEVQSESTATLRLQQEVLELEKKVEERRLHTLNKRKEELLKMLDMEEEEDSEVVFNKKATRLSKKKSATSMKGKRVSDEWEGLVNTSGDLGEVERNMGNLPSFDAIKSIFAEDEPPVKRKKGDSHQVHLKEDSDSGDEDSDGVEDRGDEGEGRNKGKESTKSGIFAKASSTKLVKQVLHVHAMTDEDETLDGRDFSFMNYHLTC